MASNKSLLIVGTGAMACLFAARLAKAGVSIFITGNWQQGLETLDQYGVTWRNQNGEEHRYPVNVITKPSNFIPFQTALVLVKSYQTKHAAMLLNECLAQNGLAVTLQNGIGNLEILADSLGRERVALGVTTAGANLIEPGIVLSAGEGKVFLVANPKIERLIEWIRTAGFEVEVVSNIDSLVWSKLVINSAINPLTALLRVPNGELMNRQSARILMTSTALESASVASAQGISLTYSDPLAAVEGVARDTAANQSSMLKDILRGSPTEIDAINGAVVIAAEHIQKSVPINRTLWQLVKALHPENS